jgi:hypothetical protein
MTAAQQTASPAAAVAHPPQKMVGEWFWRFLAVVMVATVGWVLWIMYQINPQPLITNAGFEAAAKARAAQGAKGRITPAPGPDNAAPAGNAPAQADPAQAGSAPANPVQGEAAKPPAPAPVAEPKVPPVNPERLKFTDTIETPIPERGKKK